MVRGVTRGALEGGCDGPMERMPDSIARISSMAYLPVRNGEPYGNPLCLSRIPGQEKGPIAPL